MAALCIAPAAQAVDGTITITGEITDQTCKIDSKDPPHDLVVTLPRIGPLALKEINSTAGATPFAIRISDCPDSLSGTVNAYFEPGATTDYGTGNLMAYNEVLPTGIPSSIPDRSQAILFNNVQIQLTNLNGSVIKLGQPVQEQNAQSVPLSGNTTKTATLRYLARYIRTTANPLHAGKLLTFVQYSVVYP
ncbi:fimbrial protein [Bordetella holmesii]|uniref:Fimbrial protein n=3 Tax=Bordetella holmesii TaxID=35814 RepID=A0A158M9F9_9BORD|nr:fimbrial family protein [Bordetella holmesii ATCC 51541]AIT26584.1 fimbrial family protein [Bordetella holmesii 44057]AMD45572.1 fimbrial protein [Bordetella holmesii H558]AOB34458.1 fimbrial protein [Bordetella holmesii]EWM42467.1 fimbrial family protein [Bordetella holmesii 41130]EWM47165.1 fimbrial family protein [Bordetella holmesii 35009]EWM51326.1 fimbrial family protein [Bordetella holmesii 70147]EXF88585.1 fimbrial family protein [Bordetella holmesii 30539]EXX96407.1 fimbrial fam